MNSHVAVSTRMCRSREQNAKRDAGLSPAQIAGARKAKLPATLSPELATLVDSIPQGDDWLHEGEYDGCRMVCCIDGGDVTIYSRNGKDWTATFPPLPRRSNG